MAKPDARRRDQVEAGLRKMRQGLGLDYASYRDLSEVANYSGGFTAHATGPKTGQSPKSKYMVGTADEGGRAPDPVTPDHLMSYAERNADALGRRGRFLGGWQEGGVTHLDTPIGYPGTPAGERAARRATLREQQQAYGKIDERGDYAGDVANPYHSAHRGAEVVAEDTPEQRKVWIDMPARTGNSSLRPRQGRRVQPGESGTFR